ncbi:hypothetical protein RUM43_000743 [Polyplax serrata]|uniref:Uncharacterized protein n=1 Tax=Polyplax serrata TaxID=468196 RepID=A0AAN8SGS3_POLSC
MERKAKNYKIAAHLKHTIVKNTYNEYLMTQPTPSLLDCECTQNRVWKTGLESQKGGNGVFFHHRMLKNPTRRVSILKDYLRLKISSLP